MIDREDELSVTRQCEILDLNRSGVYYKPIPLSPDGQRSDAPDRRNPPELSVLWEPEDPRRAMVKRLRNRARPGAA